MERTSVLSVTDLTKIFEEKSFITGRIASSYTALNNISFNLGAGEILLTSMNNDGTKNGFALDITLLLTKALNVPVIASGGAGTMEHFKEVFTKANADAALAASIFHYKEIEIPSLKKYLYQNKINVRI